MGAGSNWNISFQEVDPEGNLFREGFSWLRLSSLKTNHLVILKLQLNLKSKCTKFYLANATEYSILFTVPAFTHKLAGVMACLIVCTGADSGMDLKTIQKLSFN